MEWSTGVPPTEGPGHPTKRGRSGLGRVKWSLRGLYRKLAETAGDAIVASDLDGRILLFNREACRMFGYSRREVLGQPVEILLAEQDRQRHVAQRDEFRDGPSSRRSFGDGRSVVSGRRKDGTLFPAEVTVTQSRVRGTIVLSAIVRDVSLRAQQDRQEVERATRERQESLRTQALLDALPAQIALLDAAGVILSVNEGWRRFADNNGNTDPSYGVGSNYLEHCVEGTCDVAAGIRAVLHGHRPRFQIEYPCHSADEERWFTLTATPIDEIGVQRGGAIVMHVDVSEQRRAEIRARRYVKLVEDESAVAIGIREQRLRDYAEAASDWFWESDADGRITSIIGRFHEAVGLSPAQVVGKTIADLDGIDRSDPVWRELHDHAANRRAFRDLIVDLRHPDGGVRHLCISGLPVHGPDGAFLGFRGTGQDVTDAVEAERRASRTETLLAEAMAVFPGGFALWDAGGRLLRANEAFRMPFPTLGEIIRPGDTFDEILDRSRDHAGAARAELDLLAELRPDNPALAGGPLERPLPDGRWLQIRAQAGEHGGTVILWSDISELKRRERTLTAQRSLLHSTLESLDEGIAVFDRSGGLLMGNDRFVDLLGLPKRLIQPGTLLADILRFQAKIGSLGPGGREELTAHWMEGLHRPQEGEAVLRPLGRILEMRHRHMGDGRMIAVFRDITQRRRAEDALKETAWHLQERLKEIRALYEIAEIWNADDISVAEACRHTANLLPLAFQAPDATAACITIDEISSCSPGYALLDHKLQQGIRMGRRLIGHVEVCVRGIPAGLAGPNPIFLDEERRLLVTVADEIGRSLHRRQTDEALRQSEQRLSDAIAAMSEGFGYFDADDRLLLWNQQLAGGLAEAGQFLRAGATFEEITRGWMELGVLPAEGEDPETWLQRRLERHRNPGAPFEQKTTQGRTYLVNEQRTADGGTVLLRTDITDLKASEARVMQAQKLESLGTLAGGIAHDFNNALVPILTLTEMTQRRLPAGSQDASNLETVLIAARRSRDLVRQILTFSRNAESRRQTVSLADWLKAAMPLLRAGLPTTIRLETQIAPDTPKVDADDGQLTQILTNLITNAAQALPQGRGTIRVLVAPATLPDSLALQHSALAGRRLARLSVQDDGMGMAPGTLDRVFEPFFTTKGVGEGTGLGLPIVHGIVSAHGGAIGIESRRGQGTSVDVYLPIAGGKGL